MTCFYLVCWKFKFGNVIVSFNIFWLVSSNLNISDSVKSSFKVVFIRASVKCYCNVGVPDPLIKVEDAVIFILYLKDIFYSNVLGQKCIFYLPPLPSTMLHEWHKWRILIEPWFVNVSLSNNLFQYRTFYFLSLKISRLLMRMNSTIWFWYTMLTAMFPASNSGHISVGPNTMPMPWVDIRFFFVKSKTLKNTKKINNMLKTINVKIYISVCHIMKL